MAVGFVYDPVFLEHETGDHPEKPDRLRAAMALLRESGLLPQLHQIASRDATHDEIGLVHAPGYAAAVERLAREGGGWVDPDTLIMPRSYAAASRVVGSTLAALDAVVRGEVVSAFCLVRPPGHHATPVQAMGFCLFNHVAIAAAAARAIHGIERVAIVDIDVHHGNGTQDAFYSDGSVLYVSTHQYPFYPGTGATTETGAGEGRGANINIAMPAGCGDDAYAQAVDEVVLPALRRFAPGIILVSAGFDAHYADPIAMEDLSVDGYGSILSELKTAADWMCDGRLLVALEGGYDLVALPWCIRRAIEVLLGAPPTPDPLGPRDVPVPSSFAPMLKSVKKLHGLV